MLLLSSRRGPSYNDAVYKKARPSVVRAGETPGRPTNGRPNIGRPFCGPIDRRPITVRTLAERPGVRPTAGATV